LKPSNAAPNPFQNRPVPLGLMTEDFEQGTPLMYPGGIGPDHSTLDRVMEEDSSGSNAVAVPTILLVLRGLECAH
jgi:hypothetical protein